MLDAIAHPKIWSMTALLLNFDENDGFFDHVPPPVPPKPESGNGDDYFRGAADRAAAAMPVRASRTSRSTRTRENCSNRPMWTSAASRWWTCRCRARRTGPHRLSNPEMC
ncbi:alkaline phosphatase family protein [Saccharopolyspora spinosa]|uniref:alkaline phosphatase family protein n=1 Tax=Saccharopolyspora spinosa TaxID=60894 RepID=UPI00023791A3